MKIEEIKEGIEEKEEEVAKAEKEEDKTLQRIVKKMNISNSKKLQKDIQKKEKFDSKKMDPDNSFAAVELVIPDEQLEKDGDL